MTSKTVNLAQANAWFQEAVLPRRTTAAGFSGNRLWKSPRAWFVGNTEDPNGLCGDAAVFVVEEFYRVFGDYRTDDGYHIGMILWEGEVLNHMAAVMLANKKSSKNTYAWDPRQRRVQRVMARRGCFVLKNGGDDYTTSEFLRLKVYDLYYKRTEPVRSWWEFLDGGLGGTVTVGLQHDFA